MWWVGGWWSKGILEFCFGPNLGLRLEAWTKLNNKAESKAQRKTIKQKTKLNKLQNNKTKEIKQKTKHNQTQYTEYD